MRHLMTTCVLAALLPVFTSHAAEVGLKNTFPILPVFEARPISWIRWTEPIACS